MDRISRMGNADLPNIIEQGGGRNDTKLLLEDTPGGKKYLETEMRLSFLTECVAEGIWRAMQWCSGEQNNAVM